MSLLSRPVTLILSLLMTLGVMIGVAPAASAASYVTSYSTSCTAYHRLNQMTSQAKTCVTVARYCNGSVWLTSRVWVKNHTEGERDRFRASIRKGSGTWYRSGWVYNYATFTTPRVVAAVGHTYTGRHGASHANGYAQRYFSFWYVSFNESIGKTY